MNLRLGKAARFWVGCSVGSMLTAAACELPYVDWLASAPPIDERPLTIRQDARGDGRFHAPRSGRRSHRGIDLIAPLNSPVRAIRSGRVVQVGLHRGFGRYIELEHRGQLHSLYAHLNEVRVDVGQRVRQGQLIGTVGNTGNAHHAGITPHLHLEVLKDGTPVDPHTVGLRATEVVTRAAGSEARAEVHSTAREIESDDAMGVADGRGDE